MLGSLPAVVACGYAHFQAFFFFSVIFKKFLLEYSCFTISCQFLLCSEVNELYVYIYPLLFGFPSHLGHHRALSRVPCALQQVLISYLFYTQQCIYVNPNLPIHHTPLFPTSVSICLLSTSMSLFLLCKQVHLYHFSRFHKNICKRSN